MAGKIKFPELPAERNRLFSTTDTDAPLPERVDRNTRYAFFKTIARGGKSIIQSCKDRYLSRTICHKSLRPEFAKDPIERQRFLREARVTAMLQHPNTVPVYELSRDPRGASYFTMKLVHGYTLRELLNHRARYDFRQLVEVLAQVTHALEYAHTHAVAHRDLKPENILAGPFGEVLLLDWGLAKVWDHPELHEDPPEGEHLDKPSETSLTGQGNLEGTAAYMSPEQIRRDPAIDTRTDIFSMGTLLFEVLTGQLPTRANTVRGVLDQICNEEPPKPSTLSELPIPARLEEICLACLRKDPGERVQTAGELARELESDWYL